jgi:pilus assembly protein CpaC
MYHKQSVQRHGARRLSFSAFFVAVVSICGTTVYGQGYESGSVIRKISSRSEKIELTTNSSRILTLERKIPRVQVNNPELVAVTPLSATEIQLSAKKAGVTQVNLWDEEGNIHTIDLLIYGDARELALALQTQFPHSSIQVYRYSDSLVLKGYIDQPENVTPIMRLAEDYAPKVINNLTVCGAQQVLLKVRVYEVSRTKLRRLGVDWAYIGPNGGFVLNSVNEILRLDGIGSLDTNNTDTFSFGIVKDGEAFFGFLDALQRRQVAKVLAEPNLVAVSGRPAKFLSGGEIAYLVAQGGVGNTTFSVEFKQFGTIVDFVPIVLGNGTIRLEVRPEVSTPDPVLGTISNGQAIPGFRTRFVETAVEMKAGQTFAIAGLVDERVTTFNRGLPYVSDLPIIGVPFRKTEDTVDEIELLILVTPEFVEGMDPHEAPCQVPGFASVPPTNCQLYCSGHVEVPPHVNPIRGPLACGVDPCGPCQCQNGGNCVPGSQYGVACSTVPEGVTISGGQGYDEDSQGVTTITDQPAGLSPRPQPAIPPVERSLQTAPEELSLPADDGQSSGTTPPNGASLFHPSGSFSQANTQAMRPQNVAPSHYNPPRQPVYLRKASRTNNPYHTAERPVTSSGATTLIGPVGYDVQ